MRSARRLSGDGMVERTRAEESVDDLAQRAPVWIALSNLYLDTDVTLLYDHIVDTLAASSYSLDALGEILRDEVHPALYANLMVVAGDWAGFDEDWLFARLHEVRRQPQWRRRLSRWFVWRDIERDWRVLAPRIAAARAQSTDTTASA